jgi:hypothetical protein
MATSLRVKSEPKTPYEQSQALTKQAEYHDLWGLIGLAGLAVLLVGLLIWLILHWPGL